MKLLWYQRDMGTRTFIGSTIGNDPHTEGLHIAGKIAMRLGIQSFILPPSENFQNLVSTIVKYDPYFLGLSYRLSPATGCQELYKTLFHLQNVGLIKTKEGRLRRIAFAGLPETIERLTTKKRELPCDITLIKSTSDVRSNVDLIFEYFEAQEGYRDLKNQLLSEMLPPRLKILDELAKEVVKDNNYRNEPPLPIPSPAAIQHLPTRIRESDLPVIRSHFGIPDSTITPTVEGIKALADACAIDEVSLGSSDLSQRYFFEPHKFENRKNDGGVPYRSPEDLKIIYEASRRGNFPSVKPYAHVTRIVDFVRVCLKIGLLTGAHQAIPLFWFNKLDGRGDTEVPESISEHFDAVRELANHNIPVEMNDPNQWSSRGAHDTIIVTDYGLISAIMSHLGVKDIILQMQFNKPKETSDYADLAKMLAGMEIAEKLAGCRPNIWRETRTGIESLSTDFESAKWQLARSTLLQMFLKPNILHLVSYCEANYAARAEDVIDGSMLIRRAVKVFRKYEKDLLSILEDKKIVERKNYLVDEASYLLNEIAKIHPKYEPRPVEHLREFLADREVIAKALKLKLMTAPGIIHPTYTNPEMITRPTQGGFINVMDPQTGSKIITERERIELLKSSEMHRNAVHS